MMILKIMKDDDIIIFVDETTFVSRSNVKETWSLPNENLKYYIDNED